MNLEVGDRVVHRQPHSEDVVREILEVRPTGYTWRYPDYPSDRDFDPISNSWMTENSNNPFLGLGWEKKAS